MKIPPRQMAVRKRAAVLMLCLSAAVSPIGHAEDAKPEELRFTDTVHKALETALTPPLPDPVNAITRIAFESTAASKPISWELKLDYLPGGLISIIQTSAPGASTVMSSRLMLGPLPLIDAVDSSVTLNSSSAVMSGKAYIPFSMSTSIHSSRVMIATEISGDLRKAAIAAAESSFELAVANTSRRVTKTTGLLGSTRNVVVSGSSTLYCKVGVDTPAGKIFDGLRGSYREVACESKSAQYPVSKRTYAFLTESRLFVLLAERSENFSTDYRVTAVEYRS